MKKSVEAMIDMDDKLNNEQNAIYHEVSVRMGISDSTLWILYVLYKEDGICTQKAICSDWYFTKQTINTTISNMVKKGYIQLEPIPNSKKEKGILLTKQGYALAKKTANELRKAEIAAYSKLTLAELEEYIRIHQKINNYLRETTEAIHIEERN